MSAITEQQVIEFVAQRARELSVNIGKVYVTIELRVTDFADGKREIKWMSYGHGDAYRSGKTCDEACDKTLKALDPKHRAEELRAKAAAMIAEAETLRPTANA